MDWRGKRSDLKEKVKGLMVLKSFGGYHHSPPGFLDETVDILGF